jgi:deoxyribodipyrimidine photo-lyase
LDAVQPELKQRMTHPILLWLRRDLRLGDHPALAKALTAGRPVIPVYVLDDETPGRWRAGSASLWWLAGSLAALDGDLRKRGSRLVLRKGETVAALLRLVEEAAAEAVYFTRGYEPHMATLEKQLAAACEAQGIGCHRFSGQLLNEPEAVSNKAGEPFKVFTPFHKACLAKEPPARVLAAPEVIPAPACWPESEALEDWGLLPAKPDWAGGLRETWEPGEAGARKRLESFIDSALDAYGKARDLPGVDGTSRLSSHLAFGEIGPRQIWHAVRHAGDSAGLRGADAFLRELYWREFSYHLLFHAPHFPEKPFRPEFEAFPWREDARGLRAWQKGETGYPIIDAGMRQLWAIGWMHNRVRMITASFLIKHLLIPWQTGEAWFWDTLVDADLANHAASWQWVAGSGADAAPYFRVFNPTLQGKKFDPGGDYVRRWVPELAGLPDADIHTPWLTAEPVLKRAGIILGKTYPRPIVDHDAGRKRALGAYQAIGSAKP